MRQLSLPAIVGANQMVYTIYSGTNSMAGVVTVSLASRNNHHPSPSPRRNYCRRKPDRHFL